MTEGEVYGRAIERLAYLMLGMLIATIGAWIVVAFDGVITTRELIFVSAIFGTWIGWLYKALKHLAKSARNNLRTEL